MRGIGRRLRFQAIGRDHGREEPSRIAGKPFKRDSLQVMVLIDRTARQPTEVPGSWRAAVEAFEGSA